MNLRTGHTKALQYCLSVVLVSMSTVLGVLAKNALAPANIVFFYLLAVIVSAILWGRGPAVLTSVLSVLAFDFFLVPPYFTFVVNNIQYVFTFAGLLIVGLVISDLSVKTRQQTILAGKRETQTSILYRLSRDLAASDSGEAVLNVIRANISEIFNCKVAVFLRTGNKVVQESFDADFPVGEHENAIVEWVFSTGKPAGWGTDSLRAVKAHYMPLKISRDIYGVLGVLFKEDKLKLENDENDLLNALSSQAAVAIQRVKLAETSRQMELDKATEKLQITLLNSISHDLRTPLVSIKGALSSLLEDPALLDEATRRELLETAYDESDHLNRLVGNLLDMTRLESGALKIQLKPCELRDVIGAALQAIKDRLEGRDIQISIAQDMPEVPMDFTLMMRVFVNLLDNALKYSAQQTPIIITAAIVDNNVKVEVRDHGFGIPKEDITRIFDKFYRAEKPRQITGTGLGLSICKGIVEAHGGTIHAENNLQQGATFIIMLPIPKITIEPISIL
jgi:two-component system sensor histidine kinase KdpD